MSAIIDECPLCGGAKDLAMEDLRKFVAHIRDCHAAEVNDSRKELLLQVREAKEKYEKISRLYCALADTTLGTMKDLGHREAFEPGNLQPQQVEDCLTRVTQERDCANRLNERLRNKLRLIRGHAYELCFGKEQPQEFAAWCLGAIEDDKEQQTEKRFCECPGQTGAVSVNGCCVGCKLPIKFPPQKCTRDTDGDGNCWVHPQGCPK